MNHELFSRGFFIGFMAKTVEELIQRVHRIYEGDVDYPNFDDEEMELKFEHLKDGVDAWNELFPDNPVATPSDESSVVEIPRPSYLVYYILNKLYLDDDSDMAALYEVKMNEEERREKVKLAKNEDGQTLLTISGSGFGEVDSGTLLD